MLRLLRRAARTLHRALRGPDDPYRANARAVARLRAQGARIGEGCAIYAQSFSTEPYLVTLGNRVGVSGGVKFLAHDGVAWMLRPRRPSAQVFGPIEVGDDCFIGENALLLPGTVIGRGCIVAAGAVVRGRFAENSLIAGNPAKVVGRASLLIEMVDRGAGTLDTLHMTVTERRALLLRHFRTPDTEGAA
jgi:acetyltransferase-like isoleucine patch superfamily enzyme